MSDLTFKNIKFFKKEDSSQHSKNSGSGFKKKKQLNFFRKLIRNPFLYMVLFVGIIAYFISYVPSSTLPKLIEGEIASSDIIAPADMTIEDTETTLKRKTEAEEAVLPVYSLDKNIQLNTEEKIRAFFNSGRELIRAPLTREKIAEFLQISLDSYAIESSEKDIRALARLKFPINLEEALINLAVKVLDQGVILKNLLIHGEEERGLTLIREDGEQNVGISELLDIQESKQKLNEEIQQLELTSNQTALLSSLAPQLISPNVTYNNILTENRKEEARKSIETVYYNIKKGKVIIRKGDEITKDVVKQITIINKNLTDKPSWLTNFSGTFLLFALLFIALWYYIKSIRRPTEDNFRKFLLMGVTLIISLLFYKLSIFLSETFAENADLRILKFAEAYKFAFPFQFGTLLIVFLTRIHYALVFTVINSLLVGYLLQSNVYFMFFALIGGFAAIYGIKYYGTQKRTSTFRAGLLLVSPINAFLVLTFHLVRDRLGPETLFASELIMGVLGGILGASLAFLFLPVFENIFSFVTQTKLLELTNSDLPVFRQMAMEAPGSYHHSLLVSALAENAAEELKLDVMLVKAGSLYHDIGKIKRPEYFIENRAKNPDMHKDLKPSMSKLVIVNHIKEGLELAKKLKLPRKIREVIEQHHGDNLVRYFFEKAKEEYDPEMQTISEESYRYPGPRPSSKEAALVMLADSIEAASRSLKSPTKTNLKKVVSDIFNHYLQEGQLDDSAFSIKELRVIANSFLNTLYNIYHNRVEYPGFQFEAKIKPKGNKQKKENDRNTKPATPV